MITNQFRFRGELFDQYSPVVASQDPPSEDADLAREAKARKEIDKQLDATGWKAQSRKELNLSAAPRSHEPRVKDFGQPCRELLTSAKGC